MAQITFLDSNTSGCAGAVLPITIQEPNVVFNTALDGTAPTLIVGGVAGDPAPFGGTFINKGCEDVLTTITYLSGATCEPCDTETIVPVDVPWVIRANSQSTIPDGFWTGISYVLENAATDAKQQVVGFQSCHTPTCPDCIVSIPA